VNHFEEDELEIRVVCTVGYCEASQAS